MICREEVFNFSFEFIRREWGHKQRMCSGCRGRGLFFQFGKEFCNILCTLLIVGWKWVLEQVVF